MLAVQPDTRALARRLPARTVVGGLSATMVELFALCGILVAATLVRLPNLLVIPAFTDEVEEVQLALTILRNGAHPLTNVDPYIGPLWNYTLAGLFWLLGPSIAIPRGLAMATGVLTVLLTYLVGRIWFGPRVALLGAALVGASAAHAAVNSHIAWSNCITPLFTTAGLLLVAVALRDDRPRLLPAAGLLYGLAFHTHPTAVPVLVGSAAAIVVTHRRWLTTPWPYLAGVAGALVNLNLVIYNVVTNGRTFRYAQEIQESYVREAGEPNGYLARIGDLLLGLARALGNSLEHQAALLDYAADPTLLLSVTLLVLGVVLAVRQRAWLQLLVVASAVLILPLVNPKYDPMLNVRYLAPILPICLLWIGSALEWLAVHVSTQTAQRIEAAGALRCTLTAGGILLGAFLTTALVAGGVSALDRYYADVRENARTGARILELVQTAKAAGPASQPVILDERLDKMALGPGAGIVLRVLHLAFDLEDVPTDVRWLGEARPKDARPGQLVVLAARSKPQFTAEAVAALGLRPVNGGPTRVHSQASRYGMYRFGSGATNDLKASRGSTSAPAERRAGTGK